jgi:formylglycine-generating enzyme required for sulfatase activity
MSTPNTKTERRFAVSRQTHRGQYFYERLDEGSNLVMMLIPGGRFMMGQTDTERKELLRLNGDENYQGWYARELPRHSVTVASFCLGKYPVTQAQWRVVAGYPAVAQELDPDPAKFKGDNRPVEQLSWDDATEFCRRLSHRTGRTYCLPSEAIWEYACRAGITTPYHCGVTLSDELANYAAQDREIDGTPHNGVYGCGVFGEYRQETTEVGQFPANSFGLYDMHGNVWEWCEDDWHSNYEGASNDDSAWVESYRVSSNRLMRGGSWESDPEFCRSACRGNGSFDSRDSSIGFRVSCVLPKDFFSV